MGVVLSLRMLGLFMIYPVFAALSFHYAGASAFTVGLALGSYGLTQGIFQLPFGWLSDRFGRKPIIIIGLILFAAGSAMSALATTITGLILGRLIQGLGAVTSATLALIADVTREEHRTQAMALAGVLIGSSFAVAIMVGPLLASTVGLAGIFWLTGLSALLAIPFVISVRIPGWSHPPNHPRQMGQALRVVFSQPDLLRLDAGIAIQQAVLTSLFLVLPTFTTRLLGLPPGASWLLYLPVLAGAFLLSLPFVFLAEVRGWFRAILLGAILGLGLGVAGLTLDHSSGTDFVIALALYFSAFTLLEALLPSWVSRITPLGFYGTSLGVYSSCQFLGIFLGGAAGGLVLARWGGIGILGFDFLLVGVWFAVMLPIRNVKRTRTLIVPVPGRSADWADVLDEMPGVIEWRYVNEEELLYLRLDPKVYPLETLERFKVSLQQGA